ncbi:hypothetical protein QU487_15050 [Crenobacter sp. SG2305]|uniref:hypothetical protein n=1 Tax=Crenobacter oryzisoli TaxID=3056844 RepID=UPI0025AB276E|nr:hypothetical protein [Crenobacter sp. SG2305]MDN0084055.1 hypothetical protein [Crenobacter sp. SG2305]
MDQQQFNRMLVRLYRLPIVLGVAALLLLCAWLLVSDTIRSIPAPDTLLLAVFLTIAVLSFAALGMALTLTAVLAAWAMGGLARCANCRGLLIRHRYHGSIGSHRSCLACNARFCSLTDRPTSLQAQPEVLPSATL